MGAALGRGGGFLGPTIGLLKRTVAEWLSADCGALVLSSGCWVQDGFQMLSGLREAPDYGTV